MSSTVNIGHSFEGCDGVQERRSARRHPPVPAGKIDSGFARLAPRSTSPHRQPRQCVRRWRSARLGRPCRRKVWAQVEPRPSKPGPPIAYSFGLVLQAGGLPEDMSYGNTVKREADIAWAAQLGIRRFSLDSPRGANEAGSQRAGRPCSWCARHPAGRRADWSLGEKFGCTETETEAAALLAAAHDAGHPVGAATSAASSATRCLGRRRWPRRHGCAPGCVVVAPTSRW